LPVEHCPNCGVGYSRKLNPPVVIRSTDPEWLTHSGCGIYINPETPSLALSFGLRDECLFNGHLHLCQGRFLHYRCDDEIDERVAVLPKPSVRAQAARIVRRILQEWTPAHVFIATGNPDDPESIEQLNLPGCWEKRLPQH
jgi:hypothetical protein